MARKAWTYAGRRDEWPVVGDWEPWQHTPIVARQVREDGYFGLTHRVHAGDWIVRVPTDPRDPTISGPEWSAYEYLIMGDTEFRQRYRRREDMEVVINVAPVAEEPLPFRRKGAGGEVPS